MVYKMAKQRLPTREELNKYNDLCSKAFSRMTGARIDVELLPFEIPVHITKSHSLVYRVFMTEKVIQLIDLDDHKNLYGRDNRL